MIEESNPRLLAFQQNSLDYIAVPLDLVAERARRRQHAEARVRRRARSTLQRGVQPAITYLYFNMEDPVVGGYTPEKVALRRAIAMAYNVDDEIRVHPAGPGHARHAGRAAGHDRPRRVARHAAQGTTSPARRRCSTGSATSTATATACARCPTAEPLVLKHVLDARRAGSRVRRAVAAQPAARIGIKRRVRQAEVARPAQGGAARAAADVAPRQHQHDARGLRLPRAAVRARTPASRTSARFKLPEYDKLYEQARALPHGTRAREGRAPDERARHRVHAVGAHGVPHREHARASVAARATSTTRPTSIRGSTSTSTSAARGAAGRGAMTRATALATLGIALVRRVARRRRWPVAARRDPAKVLRVAFPSPRRASTRRRRATSTPTPCSARSSSRSYGFDYLARPYQRVPRTAAALPEITDNGRVWTIRVKPGIHFADDPAFKGKKRELVAADYVYAWKRLLDPRVRSPFSWYLQGKLVGADAVRRRGEAHQPLRLRRADRGLRAHRQVHDPPRAEGARLHPDGLPVLEPDGRRRARGGRGVRATRAAGRWPIRSARVRISSSRGGAARRSCSRRIRCSATRRFPASRDPRARADAGQAHSA